MPISTPPVVSAIGPKAVWFDSINLWGYNNIVFEPAVAGGAVQYANFNLRVGGVFVSKPVKVKISGVFVRVTKNPSVRLFLNTAYVVADNVIYVDVLGTRYSYKILSGDTVASVLDYFKSVFNFIGLNCDVVTGSGLVVEGELAILVTVSSAQFNNRIVCPRLRVVYDLIAASNWSAARAVTAS